MKSMWISELHTIFINLELAQRQHDWEVADRAIDRLAHVIMDKDDR